MKTTALLLTFIAGVFCNVAAQAQSGVPAIPELLNGYLFQDTNFLSIWDDQPLSQTNVAVVATWDDFGLQVDSTNAAWLSYTIESDGYPSLFLTNGTLEIWIQPNWISQELGGAGSGVWGRIIDVGQWTSNASYGWWSLFTDPSGDNLFFSAQNSSGLQTNYLTAPIAWDGTTWHQVILTYSSSSTSLYLDGALATNGPGISILPPPEALTNGFYVLSDSTGMQQFHGQADQLWIYGNQEDSNQVAIDYATYSAIANPPPHLGSLGDDDPSPPGGGGGGGGGTNSGPTANGIYSPPYGSNDFWLQILPVGTNAYNTDTNSITLILWGTIADIDYQIQMTTNIQTSNVVWTVVGDVLGSEVTNLTATTASIMNFPTVYFRALPYTLDSDGTGTPDWWQLQNFGYVGVDPYADPMGDGYTILYEYQNGMNPNAYYTPPAPMAGAGGFSAIVNTNGSVVVSWAAAANLPSSGAGAVTGYTLEIEDAWEGTNDINFGTNELSFETNINGTLAFFMEFPYDYLNAPPPPYYVPPPLYSLRINYANGSSQWTPFRASFDTTCTVNGAVTRGTQGNLYLIVSSVPTNVVAVRVMCGSYGVEYPINPYGWEFYAFTASEFFYQNIISSSTNWPIAYFDVPLSSLTNGVYQIPPSQAPLFGAFSINIMGLGANGNLGSVVMASPTNQDSYLTTLDLGPHNLNIPFLDGRTNIQQNINMLLRGAGAFDPFNLGLYSFDADGDPEGDFGIAGATNFVWDGFSFLGHGYVWDGSNWNFTTYAQRNEFEPFEETSLFTNLIFNPDIAYNIGSINIYQQNQVQLTNGNCLFNTYGYVTSNSSFPLGSLQDAVLTSTVENWICSPENIYSSILNENGDGQFTLPSGSTNLYGLAYQYVEYLATNGDWTTSGPGVSFSIGTNQDFFQNVASPIMDTVNYYFARPGIDPQPGEAGFSTTNTTPPFIIIPFGKEFFLTAWAKQSLLNGSSSIFAYPEQYFDKAWLADTNGDPTTNQTGILSEYGDFFPTQPGGVILTTKPDAATGTTNQCHVYVIKLQLDVNSDGTMDTSFAGPDNTCADRPFVFWVNSDCDHSSGPNDPGKDIINPKHPDYSLANIQSQRDLEDWARLWICGLPPVITNFQITLGWTNVQSGSPVINMAVPVETNGGTLYLTDTNIAASQVGGTSPFSASYKFARITTNSAYTFNPYLFNGTTTNFFLFEGAGIGKGELVMTISQGSNVVATTSAFMDLHNVRDFYEQAIITNSNSSISNMTSAIEAIEPPAVSDPNINSDTNIIVYIHGASNNENTWLERSDTVFKRLHWSGFKGKFSSVRWPSVIKSELDWFNTSEAYGYKAASSLKTYLALLREQSPDSGLHIFAHSQGGAITSEAINEGATFDTLILSQVAMAASCYDVNSPTNSTLVSYDVSPYLTPQWQPMGYAGIYTNLTGRRIFNWFNNSDALLKLWLGDQELEKPSEFYSYDGSNCWYLYNSDLHLYRLVTDTQESRAMISRARSWGIGAQGPTNGLVSQGIIQNSIDLYDYFDIGDTTAEHSAFYTRPIQSILPFFQQILIQIQPDE